MVAAQKVIHAEDLQKSFGRFRALRGLDLVVERGEIHGFLGPNGAGKSTTLRVLLGLLRADGGSATILGMDPWNDAVALHERLAYVPGDVALWPGLSGGEAISLLGSLRGGIDPVRRDRLIERFELDPRRKGRQYSKGNRQKVALVAAFAADVDVLLLDEPTSGLDPRKESVFQDELLAARGRGATVLLSSHLLGEVEHLADRLSIVKDGVTVRTGSLAELRGHARATIHARFRARPVLPLGLDDESWEGNELTASVDEERLDVALRALADAGVASLTVEPPSLESLFLGLYSSQAAGAEARP